MSCVLAWLLALMACGGVVWWSPSEPCAPHQVFDPRDPAWQQSFVQKRGAWGCLQLRWGSGQGQTIPVWIGDDGKVLGYDSKSQKYAASPTFQGTPREGSTRQLRLFVLRPEALSAAAPGGDHPKHLGLCRRITPGYDCQSPTHRKICWFAFAFAPNSSCQLEPPPCVEDARYRKECQVGQGPCTQKGAWLCGSEGHQLVCSAKPDAQNKRPEVCNGIDDDCDGTIDPGCLCTNGQTRACGSDLGECTKGTQTCKAGKWGPCAGERPAQAESCNGKDDDCDGKVDNGCQCVDGQTRACGSDLGECTKGIQTCVGGQWSPQCKGQSPPKTEACNGKDDDCDGKVDNGCWVRSAGGHEEDQTSHVAIDAQGNVYIAGTFRDAISFGAVATFRAAGAIDSFVAKLDRDGNWLWAKQISSPGTNDHPYIGLDANGNPYVVGHFTEALNLGSRSLQKPPAGRSYFVAKMDPTGQWQWVTQANGGIGFYVEWIAVNASGEVHLGGIFNAIQTPQKTIDMTSKAAADAFLLKLSNAGQWLWGKGYSGPANDRILRIDALASGDILVAGDFQGRITIDGKNYPSVGGTDVFLMGLDKRGQTQWVKAFGSRGGDRITGLRMTKAGLLVSGCFEHSIQLKQAHASLGKRDIFVARLNASQQWDWSYTAGGALEDCAWGLGAGPKELLYLSGNFTGTAAFGNQTLKASGDRDIFVGQLTPAGTWTWLTTISHSLKDGFATLWISPDLVLHMAGTFHGDTRFFDYVNRQSKGKGDLFIARFPLP